MQTPNDYKQVRENLFQQALGAEALVADTALPEPCRAIYVGGSGDATFQFADGTQAAFTGLVAGQVYPFAILKFIGNVTTATGLVALH